MFIMSMIYYVIAYGRLTYTKLSWLYVYENL